MQNPAGVIDNTFLLQASLLESKRNRTTNWLQGRHILQTTRHAKYHRLQTAAPMLQSFSLCGHLGLHSLVSVQVYAETFRKIRSTYICTYSGRLQHCNNGARGAPSLIRHAARAPPESPLLPGSFSRPDSPKPPAVTKVCCT